MDRQLHKAKTNSKFNVEPNVNSASLDLFLHIFLKDKEYDKSMCKTMKSIIYQEILTHRFFTDKLSCCHSFLYFIRIRKDDGNIYKIGITHNSLMDRIASINNNDFKGVCNRIIIIGCTQVRGQKWESFMKKQLKQYIANKYEREKRNKNLSTESYIVSAKVYNKIRHLFIQHNHDSDNFESMTSQTFWSRKYHIDIEDNESYYGYDLGENSIFMED